jgi:hypothetical protein
MHEPQPVHLLKSIVTALFILMACSGQMSTHNPQLTQHSWFITAVIFRDLFSPSEAVLDGRSIGADKPVLVASISAILWVMALS